MCSHDGKISKNVRQKVVRRFLEPNSSWRFRILGYGQVVPVTKFGRLATIFYGLFGIPMMLLFLANLGSLMADVFRIAYKKICCRFARDRKQESEKGDPPTWGHGEFVHNPGWTLRVRKESRSVRIPVWLILCSFFLYLFMGAMIFAYWENWTFLDAMYFVFVTVSTIGFGDMLPGMDDAHPVHRTNKFISALVYLLFGLAMVAMCFDLIQLEVKRKSKRLARRIGLISSM
ncbi:unnamed protein product [Mesocestoides corti]|uniref:Potassium channel domain-containing protein n=1 Tax=Mesocestoides corti TaxID=53468 RepID=A0A0R3UMT3_MESCO|nr:unnamed protein product [Mesocestoides corti]